MGSYSGTEEEEEEEEYFESHFDISSLSDSDSDRSGGYPSSELSNSALGYEFWSKGLDSVGERRNKFFKWMDEEEDSSCNKEKKRSIDRLKHVEEAMLANLASEPKFLPRSFLPHNAVDLIEDENLDNETLLVDELANNDNLTQLLEVSSDEFISFPEFQKALGSSELVGHSFQKDSRFNFVDSKKKEKSSWLKRFSAMTNSTDGMTKRLLQKPNEINPKMGSATGRVRVHVSKKQSKELSSLYRGQEFHAHSGSILTVKFSPDGQYLASGGADGVVRVWRVLIEDTVNKFNAEDMDPSCLYFSMDHSSKLSPLDATKEKTTERKMLRKSSDSACIILPSQVFHLLEKPLHEFHGHSKEVLALSWSKSQLLLSSSTDKTARLWRIGHESCLRVYSHNDYVTCVEFNPVDDNHFISGSIDGKLRIWEVHGGRVIDWTDIREIVTAVSYCPDGKGGIVGSMDGNCCFFDIIDNRLQLGDQVSLKGKKKLQGKRITGFQYCPNDTSKVMVALANSQVQIIDGTNILCKFKGNGSSGSQVAASFTADGEHIILGSEDSNICVWNYNSRSRSTSGRDKKPCESFWAQNSCVAVPWNSKVGTLPTYILRTFSDGLLHKGSAATWPEEKLLETNPMAASLTKSEVKLLKNTTPNLWGLVVVTAGWDGCIRTYVNYGLPITTF